MGGRAASHSESILAKAYSRPVMTRARWREDVRSGEDPIAARRVARAKAKAESVATLMALLT